MTPRELLDLPLYSRVRVDESTSVVRVPGGSLYERIVGSTGGSVFMPEPLAPAKRKQVGPRVVFLQLFAAVAWPRGDRTLGAFALCDYLAALIHKSVRALDGNPTPGEGDSPTCAGQSQRS